MIWSTQQIRRLMSGRLMGNTRVVNIICETLLLLPPETINYIVENVWFISSMQDAWAFTLTANDVKNKHLIILSDELIHEGIKQIRYTILHEIGHMMMGHKNSIGYMQTKREIIHQEREADKFAMLYTAN
jgi:hypothetical protein